MTAVGTVERMTGHASELIFHAPRVAEKAASSGNSASGQPPQTLMPLTQAVSVASGAVATAAASSPVVSAAAWALGEAAEAYWPGWSRDLHIAKAYEDKIKQAFRDALSAVRAYLQRLFTGYIRVTPTQAAQQIRSEISGTLKPVLDDLWAESYATGYQSAGALLPEPTSEKPPVPDWGWQPGAGRAAAEPHAGGGLQQLIEQHGQNITERIAETRLDDLPGTIVTALDKNQTAEETTSLIQDALKPDSRSGVIAQTEVARAVNAGAMARYLEDGVDRKQWAVAPDETVCFPANTHVLTPSGNVPIENLKPGDAVITPNGVNIITAVSVRSYTGGVTVIESHDRMITATDNHPFMTKNGWRAAGIITDKDVLQTAQNEYVQVTRVTHFMFSNSHDRVSHTSKLRIFNDVFNRVQVVPVIAVNFNDDVNTKEHEVNNTFTGVNLRLKEKMCFLKCQSNRVLDTCFTFISPIALYRAKSPSTQCSWPNANLLLTMKANNVDRWAPTLFRAKTAILPARAITNKLRTTPFAINVKCTRCSAIPRAENKFSGFFFGDSELVFARWANLYNAQCTCVNAVTAISAIFSVNRTCDEFFTTTDTHCRWVNNSADMIAFSRTELSCTASRIIDNYAALRTRSRLINAFTCSHIDVMASKRAELSLRSFTLEDFSALLTSNNSRQVSSNYTQHITSSKPLLVYNITVAEDHVYYANDFLVHNCKICRKNEADGSIPLSQPFSSGTLESPAHPRCRCAVIPASVGGIDLTDMFSEPLPGYNVVPMQRAPAEKSFNPAEPRDLKGEWTRSLPGYEHSLVYVGKSTTPQPDLQYGGYSYDDDSDFGAKEIGKDVTHPELGHGKITGLTQVDQNEYAAHVKFDSGAEREFEVFQGDEAIPLGLRPRPAWPDLLTQWDKDNPDVPPWESDPAEHDRMSTLALYADSWVNDHLNQMLRSGEDDLELAKYVKPDVLVHDLDEATNAYELQSPVTMHRGVAATPELLKMLRPGTEFTDPSYTSVSTSPDIARIFGKMRVTGKWGSTTADNVKPVPNAKPVVMHIHMPAGATMAPVMHDQSLGEHVLPRGTTFRVNSVNPDQSEYDVSVIPS